MTVYVRAVMHAYIRTNATAPIETSQQTAAASLPLHRWLAQYLLQHESCSNCNAYYNVATDCHSFASSASNTSATSTATRELQYPTQRRNRLQQPLFICTGNSRNIYCNTRAAAAATPIETSQQTATTLLHPHPSPPWQLCCVCKTVCFCTCHQKKNYKHLESFLSSEYTEDNSSETNFRISCTLNPEYVGTTNI